MLFSVSMFPIASARSLAEPVAMVVDELDRAGLHFEVTGMDTVIEGEWDTVMPVIKRAEERVRADFDRVFMVLTMDDHKGTSNRLHESVNEVERILGRSVRHALP